MKTILISILISLVGTVLLNAINITLNTYWVGFTVVFVCYIAFLSLTNKQSG